MNLIKACLISPSLFLVAGVPAFAAVVTVTDSGGNELASGATLNAVAGSLADNTVVLSSDVTETARLSFTNIDENMEITIRSATSEARTITGGIERKQAVQNTVFLQTGDKKKITLNLENIRVTNPNGYFVCGVNVAVNGENAVFSGCNNPEDGSSSVGEGGVIRTTGNANNSMSSAGTVTITGTNTFTNNSAAKGGAIYASKSVTFSGNDSAAIFRGNVMSGTDESEYTAAGKNDIFVGAVNGGGVTFKGTGAYVLDGGIRTMNTASGNLVVNSGASVTFESGAVNIIKNKTTVSGAELRFENFDGSNKLMNSITIAKDGVMVVAEGAQIVMGSAGNAVSLTATSEGSVLGIELCDAYLADTGKAAIVGDADGTSNTLDVTGITLSAADGYALEFALKNAETYSYKIFDATTVSAALTKEDFILGEDCTFWEIEDYEDGVITLRYIPEPSAFAWLAGLGSLALVASRRRRINAASR